MCIVGYYECGMLGLNVILIFEKVKECGVEENCLNLLLSVGFDLKLWLIGFYSVEESVFYSVNMIKNYLLLLKKVLVYGFVIYFEIGKFDVVINGYEIEFINIYL